MLTNDEVKAMRRDEVNQLSGKSPRKGAMKLTVSEIASVAHEVNRQFCRAFGDDSQPSWSDAPEWQRTSAENGVRFHLDQPDAGPEASHESWLNEKAAAGWTYGPTKDPVAKTHPCFVPFAELPREQQAKDYLFRGVVHALAEI